MKCDECTMLIFFRKHIAFVKQQAIGCHVAGESHYRIYCIFTAFFFPIPTVFWPKNFFVLDFIIINVRPAGIITFV